MREYLFRGKRKDNGQWVEGCLVSVTPDEAFILVGITGHIKRDDYECYMIEVVPKTIGQFTGLKDKNGKKIYEGDVIQFKSTDSYEYDATYDYEKLGSTPVISVMKWNSESLGFRTSASSRFKITKDMLEVIGNIHDNPELVNQPNGGALNMNIDPNVKAEEATQQEIAPESAALNAAEDQANDALGEPTQDSEEGSTEG